MNMEWISVKDRLPEHRGDVLIFYDKNGGEYGVGWFSCAGHDPYWVKDGAMLSYNVTHWMHLPPPPEVTP